MKRSEAVEEIRKILAINGKDNGEGELEEAILNHLENLGMFYCPVEDLGEFQLRTPKGWESEDSTINTEKAINKMLEKIDNDKETRDILTRIVPDGVKLK